MKKSKGVGTIEFQRSLARRDSLRLYRVEIDGLSVGAIALGGSTSFEVPAGRHFLRVRLDVILTCKLLIVEVHPGEHLFFCCGPSRVPWFIALAGGWARSLALHQGEPEHQCEIMVERSLLSTLPGLRKFRLHLPHSVRPYLVVLGRLFVALWMAVVLGRALRHDDWVLLGTGCLVVALYLSRWDLQLRRSTRPDHEAAKDGS